MDIYKYEFKYTIFTNGVEVCRGIETAKGYNESIAKNNLRTRLEEGSNNDEEIEIELIPYSYSSLDNQNN